ncbi:hypothetical protein HDU93_005996 [Gonapodya sp. JEL0774]|nr:hypothetical protein HDU93_005996 [Gonapodya sp. JEL0774]
MSQPPVVPGRHRKTRTPFEPSDASTFYFSFTAPDANEVIFESELDNWGEGKSMERCEDDRNKWEITIEVPWEGDDLLFKFRVDGKWTLSPDYPTRKLGEHENNFTHIPIVDLSQPKKAA